MKFNELKSIIQQHRKEAIKLKKNPGYYVCTSSPCFICHKKLFYMLKSLNYEGWRIEELCNGSWQTFYEERGIISDYSSFLDEETACIAFLNSISSDWHIKEASKNDANSIIIYPTLIINGIVVRDDATITKFWNTYIGSDKAMLGKIFDKKASKSIGRYSISNRKIIPKHYAEKMGLSDISPNGVMMITIKKDQLFDINTLQ